MTTPWTTWRWLAVALTAALLASLAVGGSRTAQEAAAAQVAPTVNLNAQAAQTYLGPEVVISGSASSPVGVDRVEIVVRDTESGDYLQSRTGGFGPNAVDLGSFTATLPPPGDPAVSWRVPLTLADGAYEVVATATDTVGGSTSTAPLGFAVDSSPLPPLSLVEADAVWRYSDLGATPPPNGVPAANWFEAAFDDGAWLAGPAELGYGDGDEATVTAATDSLGQPVITTYFRHSFQFTGAAEYSAVELTMLRDDGAVVYLNGQEIMRSNMPLGPIDYGTFASAVSEQTDTLTLNVDDFLVGTNVIAVEVHQVSTISSDISFSLDLVAQPLVTALVSDNRDGTYVLAAGDIARCNFFGDEAVAAQVGEYFDTDAGVFIGLGDLVYNSGTIDEFLNCYEPTLGQFKDVTWPAPGNHEHFTAPNAAGYRSYFGEAAGPLAGPNGGLWYSFDIDDDWHVVALDSDCQGGDVLPGAVGGDGCAVGSDQEQWLRADLAANADKNIMAFWHHPSYTNNQYTDFTYTWPLWQALAEFGADLSLHGHEHHYERYAPLDYWGVPDNQFGIREFIIGSGGTFPRYDIRPQEPESEFRGTFPQGTNDFGVLQLWLRPDGYDWKWQSIEGLAAVDEGSSGLSDPMPLATISGTAENSATGDGISGIEVCAIASRTGNHDCVFSNALGDWAIGPLVTDSYTISSIDPSFEFIDIAIEGVALNAPIDTTDVTLSLDPLLEISGSVTRDPGGDPIAGAQVCATALATTAVICVTTDGRGQYNIGDLEGGDYTVEFSAAGYKRECYADIVDCTSADVVTLFDADAVGINAALEPVVPPTPTPTITPTPSPTPTPTAVTAGNETISGTISLLADGSPIFGVQACAVRAFPPGQWCDLTNTSGSYSIDGLASGNYSLIVSDPSFRYAGNCWGSSPCANAQIFGVSTVSGVTVRDVSLDPFFSASQPTPTPTPLPANEGTISGTVRSAGTPASGIEVCATSVLGGPDHCVRTDAAGHYTIEALATGNYRVSFAADTQCYRTKNGCVTFTPVGLVSPFGRTGIDGSV